MKLLVLATDYPDNNGNVALMYVHTRNKYYVENGLDVTVINFCASQNYTMDGVKVITLKEYGTNKERYDILLSHAPNIRNHYMFFKKYDENFEKIILFFHGHEVLKVSKTYPKPYPYTPISSKPSIYMRNIYDFMKLRVWKKYFINKLPKLTFVFVSNWMYEMFLKYVKLDSRLMNGRKHIIYNSIAKDFEINDYEWQGEKVYDFITIRGDLDESKYAVDVMVRAACLHPKYKFCVVGKGNFFYYNNRPKNLEWINKNLSHTEIIEFLNKSRCAFLPTRTDAQGVMACEMATFGIPLITSGIPVCKEVFMEFENVGYIDNDTMVVDMESILDKLQVPVEKNKKYFSQNTIGAEVDLIVR
jgi:glycosyltransferase involved in cell wall biosynthesis